MTNIRIANLTKTYGSGENAVDAVRDVSFETKEGDFVALVGPSGSGKTTLLAMIGGLLTPTSGQVFVNEREVSALSDRDRATYRRKSVGYVFQANNLVPYLTARENLTLMAAIGATSRGEAGARADQLLRELGIEKRAHALANVLSGGERQRVAIARALMNDSELVLVDEPTASLDSSRGKLVVESLINEVKTRGKVGLMVTHDLAMAELADQVLEMHDGQLTAVRAAARG